MNEIHLKQKKISPALTTVNQLTMAIVDQRYIVMWVV